MEKRIEDKLKKFWYDYYDDDLFDVGDLLMRGGDLVSTLANKVLVMEDEIKSLNAEIESLKFNHQ